MHPITTEKKLFISFILMRRYFIIISKKYLYIHINLTTEEKEVIK